MVDGMQIVGEGAEAKVYRSKLLGIEVAVKKRMSKRYRIEQLDRILRASRTKTEARILAMLAEKNMPVPVPLLVTSNSIYMDWIGGQKLSDILGNVKTAKHFLEESGSILGKLHGANVCHGDYTPANLIASGGKLRVIDFGLASVTNSIEDKALDILLMKRAIPKTLYSAFLAGYTKSSKNYLIILEKLKEIELRGRYQTRTLSSN
jgi:Kae1-associated kinase Bud32